uniref:NPC1_N domain-containing protein n=1 Tax=Rhabditophanes sp. KR3021 TaxID=114890 RepID=A0AC35TNV0_9BILA
MLLTALFLLFLTQIELPDEFRLPRKYFEVIGGYSPYIYSYYKMDDLKVSLSANNIHSIFTQTLQKDVNLNKLQPLNPNVTEAYNQTECTYKPHNLITLNNSSLAFDLKFGVNQEKVIKKTIANCSNSTQFLNSLFPTLSASEWCQCGECKQFLETFVIKRPNDTFDVTCKNSYTFSIVITTDKQDKIYDINISRQPSQLNCTTNPCKTILKTLITYNRFKQDDTNTIRFDTQKGRFFCPAETRCLWEVMYFMKHVNYNNSIEVFMLFIPIVFLILMIYAIDDNIFNEIKLF